MVEGLVLINVNPCAEGWMDWAASKVSLGAWVSRGYPTLQRDRRARLCLEDRLQGISPHPTPPPPPAKKAAFLCWALISEHDLSHAPFGFQQDTAVQVSDTSGMWVSSQF